MRTPYTKTLTLYLTGSARSWQMAGWDARWTVGKTIPAA